MPNFQERLGSIRSTGFSWAVLQRRWCYVFGRMHWTAVLLKKLSL